MENELRPYKEGELETIPAKEFLKRVQKMQMLLNRDPDKQMIQKNTTENYEYLPVSHIEMLLDEMFFGQWSIVDFKWIQVVNEIAGSLVLEVTHPITGKIIKRTGVAAVQIKQDKGAPITDFVSTKKKNALQLDFPKLKAECLKNAAQTLGNIFGRDLRRKVTDEYNQMIPEDSIDLINKVIKELDKYTGNDKEEIKGICMEKQRNDEFTEIFAAEILKRLKNGTKN